MMSAKATMEHRIRGQIGQPAACMIDSNGVSQRRLVAGGVGAGRPVVGWTSPAWCRAQGAPQSRRLKQLPGIMADGAAGPAGPCPWLQGAGSLRPRPRVSRWCVHWREGAAPDRSPAGPSVSRAGVVHRICGQTCGQALGAFAKPAPGRDQVGAAELSSTENLLQINHLQRVRASSGLSASRVWVAARWQAGVDFTGELRHA
jgi:hypothetical protein